jgi:hypothetical protein
MGSHVVLVLGPPRGTNFGGQWVETWSRAPGPALATKGGRPSQLALASRQRRASSGRFRAWRGNPQRVCAGADELALRHPKADFHCRVGAPRQHNIVRELLPRNGETESENGPDSRTTWWSRKRDHGLRSEVSTKCSFLRKSYTEVSFVVAAWQWRGPVFGTRIWSSKWDRKLAHGRTKNGHTGFQFRTLGFEILRAFGVVRRPPFADPRPTLNQPRLAHEAAQAAAPHGNGGRRWSGEHGGGSGTRHATANSTVAHRCPPYVVPPGGPIFGVTFLNNAPAPPMLPFVFGVRLSSARSPHNKHAANAELTRCGAARSGAVSFAFSLLSRSRFSLLPRSRFPCCPVRVSLFPRSRVPCCPLRVFAVDPFAFSLLSRARVSCFVLFRSRFACCPVRVYPVLPFALHCCPVRVFPVAPFAFPLLSFLRFPCCPVRSPLLT